jgi:hypothetical protein
MSRPEGRRHRPAIRWSVACRKVGRTRIRARGWPARAGLESFVYSGWSRDLRVALAAAGGDEETRTPDPLLAKEMLYQLSYVPVRTGVSDGGRFWTRTRDLCLIRAVL